MKNYIYTFLFFICFNSLFSQDLKRIGTEFSGIQVAIDTTGKEYFVNSHDVVIANVESVEINPHNVINKISKSSIEGKELILRILSMYPESQKLVELKNTAKTYSSINNLLMEEYYTVLKSSIGQREFEQLLNKRD